MSSATSAIPAQSRVTERRFSRDEALALADEAPAWTFLRVGLDALEVAPQDVEMRLRVVGAFAVLGLRTPAMEHLDRLDKAADTIDARRAIESLSDDRMQAGRLTRMARAAAHTLAEQGIDIQSWIGAWRAGVEAREWFLASDGNIVIRDAASLEWLSLSNEFERARSTSLPHLDEHGAPRVDVVEDPVYVDGLASPWLLTRLRETTPPTSFGYQPRIVVVVERVDEFLNAAAKADLREAIEDPRVEFFVGDDAIANFDAWLGERHHTHIRGPVVHMPAQATGESSVEDVLRAHLCAQADEAATLDRQMQAVYMARDSAWWRRRFEEAGSGGAPLRAVVLTTRNSSFLRHSANDLAEGLRHSGCEVRVLMEPDNFTRLASIRYAQEFVDFEPDLVIQFNYPRSMLANAVPANVPFVCWAQDRMAHLFDPSVGAAQSPLDFLIGNLYAELFVSGFDARRARHCPIVVSEIKFHDGRVTDDQRDRFACDVAYVSHQSEPVEVMTERMIARAGGQTLVQRFLRRLAPVLQENVETMPEIRRHWARFHLACEHVRESDPSLGSIDEQVIWRDFGHAFTERVIRMQTLRWARSICKRRGWSLRLYGNGWERNPEFAEFAAGEIQHGDDLRACYQCAGAHLHASAFTTTHQRVLECALSGGLMLRRVAVGDLEVIEQEIARLYVERTGCSVDTDCLAVEAAAPETNEEMSAYNAMRAATGLIHLPVIKVRRHLLNLTLARPPVPLESMIELSMDGADETRFKDEATLESALQRTIENRDLRSQAVTLQQHGIRERMTYDVISHDVIQWLGDAL